MNAAIVFMSAPPAKVSVFRMLTKDASAKGRALGPQFVPLSYRRGAIRAAQAIHTKKRKPPSTTQGHCANFPVRVFTHASGAKRNEKPYWETLYNERGRRRATDTVLNHEGHEEREDFTLIV